MNLHDHHAIVRLAFASLRQRADGGLLALQERIAENCMLPDQVAIPLLEGKHGPWRRYFPRVLPKFNFEHDQRDLHSLLPANGFYIRAILRALRRREYDEAARFLGVYSHYIGDFTQPAHHYELDIGLLAGEARQAACRFEVLTDGRSRFASPSLRPGDCAMPVVVDMLNCRTLRLQVTTDGSTDKLAFPIWGRPRLLKH